MTLTFQGRLPGIACIATLPAPTQPIRLDVPAFVGFAQRGPVSSPSAVEDINQYQALFGGDLVLAQDSGVPVYARLPATVKSFFDNGGARCYVVRVAGPNAVAARWQVPGLRQWRPDGTVSEVYVGASSPGAWSSVIEVGTQLLRQPLGIAGDGVYRPANPAGPGSLPLSDSSARDVQPGDLIQLDIGPSWAIFICACAVRPDGVITASAEVPALLGPAGLLPGPIPVMSATLLRFDLVVRLTGAPAGAGLEPELWQDLTFNPPGPTFWRDVTQQTEAIDPARSALLRADPMSAGSSGVFVPLDMDDLGTSAEFADATTGSLPDPGVIAGDDDLSSFDAVAMFLDPHLLDDSVYDLIDDANQYTVLSPDPIQLGGVHSLIGVDEVAMISVPDAAHVGWTQVIPEPPTQPAQPTPPSPPAIDWSRFRSCDLPAPPLAPPPPAPPPPTAPPYPELNDVASYDPSGLIRVQIALAQLCAARADAVAVLSLPSHYRADDYMAWWQRFTNDGRIIDFPLSYACVWHPWVQVVEPSTPQLAPLRAIPPDGPAAGTIAATENASGVWVAPANIALRGVIGLTQALIASDEVSLFNAHDNLLVHTPGGFIGLSAHTLSADPILLQLSVRRLLILLRKIALLRGMQYVFMPDTDRFRQMVRRSFERLLSSLTQVGAIVNFGVSIDSGADAPGNIEEGQLLVQLLVAPTDPVEFITVTLRRAGEGLLDVLEGSR